MSLLEDYPPTRERREIRPSLQRRLRIEAMLAQLDQAEVGAQMVGLWKRCGPSGVKVKETRPIRYQGHEQLVHMEGARVVVHDPRSPSERRGRFQVARLAVRRVDTNGAPAEVLDPDFCAAYFNAEQTAALFEGAAYRPRMPRVAQQGVALRLHTDGASYEVTLHPFRNLNVNRPWDVPDNVISDEVEFPPEQVVLARMADLFERAEPLAA